MLFISGKTACTGCGERMDVTDDTVAATPVVVGGTRWTGFYHRDCFALLPDAADLTRRWRAYTEAQVRSSPKLFPVVAESARFLLVQRTGERQLGLYHLGGWAEQRFRSPEEWGEFADLLRGDGARAAVAAGEGKVASAGGAYTVLVGPKVGRVGLTWAYPLSREIEYPKAAFDEFTAAHGRPSGPTDFAQLAADGLTPSFADGALARCQGEVTRIDTTPAGYRVVYSARPTVTVELGADGLAELRGLVAKANRRSG